MLEHTGPGSESCKGPKGVGKSGACSCSLCLRTPPLAKKKKKKKVGFSPAECVYGTNLVLPGQLQFSPELPTSPQPLQDYTAHLKADMAAARCPEPAWHTATTRAPIPATLRDAKHVSVRHGARRVPLTRPYDGPSRVVERGEKFFTVKVGTKEQVITVDRLKPAFGFAYPAPPTSAPKEGGATVLKTTQKKKKTLNPAAEMFVPAEVRTRAGRTIRQPERLKF